MTSPSRYTLTWRDALAYESLPRQGLSDRLVLFGWLGLAGVLAVALPEALAGETWSPRFWAVAAVLVFIQYLLFVVVRRAVRRARARHRYPAPVEAEIEWGGDHFALIEGGRRRIVRFEDISMMLPMASHLFMAVGDELVIVPLVAFGDEAGMAEAVEAIDGYMHAHYADLADADAIVVSDDPELGQ
jgi:hypothetical protein